ncbi:MULTISPECIES: hypothetical protein [unclassified Streptomyces]|uniref:hypothetical protein n=1 Tax=Streptomyces sp. NPDC127532 TaxID=3345399 RepID=UPI00363C3322
MSIGCGSFGGSSGEGMPGTAFAFAEDDVVHVLAVRVLSCIEAVSGEPQSDR